MLQRKLDLRVNYKMYYIKTGDRIKYYRNLLHLTRKELSMGRLSYELIYFLEKGKKKLTPVTAGILVSNFHEIANKKGIQINLAMKDLLMSDTDYANTLCNKWLNEVEEVPYDETKYLKIIQLAREFNLTESINKAYKKIACHYFTENNYLKALKYFEELLPLSLLIGNHTENINILNKMGTCCYMLRDYNKAFSITKVPMINSWSLKLLILNLKTSFCLI